MSELTQADQFLLDAIESGDASGWQQLVERYQGRLLAFAVQRLKGSHVGDAEDLVQDTFLRFLQSLKSFRRDASVETYLYSILRRRIIDVYRGREGRMCLLADVLGPGRDSDRQWDPIEQMTGSDSSSFLAQGDQGLSLGDDLGRGGRGSGRGVGGGGGDLTASWYVRQDESRDRFTEALALALKELVRKYQSPKNQTQEGLRDLQILEMVFYAQLPNKKTAELTGVRDNWVGLLKHRSIKRIQNQLEESGLIDDQYELPDNLLTQAWEQVRPSCPKRNTIGQLMLGTLDSPWKEYVHFHVHELGCRFCKANWDDMQNQSDQAGLKKMRKRVMESTIGLLAGHAK